MALQILGGDPQGGRAVTHVPSHHGRAEVAHQSTATLRHGTGAALETGIRGLAETMHSGLVREVWGPVLPGRLPCRVEEVVHRRKPTQRGQSSQDRVRLRHAGRYRDQEFGWSLDPTLPEAGASWHFLVTGTNSPWDFAFFLRPIVVPTNSKVCAHMRTRVPRAPVHAVWGLL